MVKEHLAKLLKHLNPVKPTWHAEPHSLNCWLAATRPPGGDSRYGNVGSMRDLGLPLGGAPVAVVPGGQAPKRLTQLLVANDLNRRAIQHPLRHYLKDRTAEKADPAEQATRAALVTGFPPAKAATSRTAVAAVAARYGVALPAAS